MFDFLATHSGPVLALLFVLLGGSVGWNLFLLRQGRSRQTHHDELLQAVENEGIESVLGKQAKDITRLSHDAQELYAQTETLQTQTQGALSRISVLRFNPFGDAGGNQSFVCALLNTHGSGLVLSSLHHRTGNRIYAKPITNGSSPFPLSQEEQKALQEAMGSPLSTTPVQKAVQQQVGEPMQAHNKAF